MTKDELARLKAIAFGNFEGQYDATFWTTPANVQALIMEVERCWSAAEPPSGGCVHCGEEHE